jgi:hypothetical protein
MEQKKKIKELLQQFNNPPIFDMNRNGIFELIEDCGLLNDEEETRFVIKAYVVFHSKAGTKQIIMLKRWESPPLELKDLVEQLVRYSEEFYKIFYIELINYTLFAKEIKLQDDREGDVVTTPIAKLILGSKWEQH